MHQAHNIPWHLFASNFEFLQNDKSLTPNITYLKNKGKPNASQELKHLIRKFIKTIITFSETERKKYPLTFERPTHGKIFSDEIRDRYPDYLNESNQRIEYWIARAHRGDKNDPRSYDRLDVRLADVVKVLLYENQLSTLLMLAHHPDISIGHLHTLSWRHRPGFERVKESSIHAYIFFNSAYATGILENGSYRELNEYHRFIRETVCNMDFQNIQFLTRSGVNFGSLSEDAVKRMSVHGDMEAMRDYLKTLFALMYRYDILMRECGMDPKWEEELTRCTPLFQDAKMIYW